MKKILLSIVLSMASLSAMAHTGFSCQTTDGKQLALTYDDEGTVTYLYGKSLKSPEVKFSQPYNKVRVEHITDHGRNVMTVLMYKNKSTSYYLTWGQMHQYMGDVEVEKNGQLIQEISCEPSTINDPKDSLFYNWNIAG